MNQVQGMRSQNEVDDEINRLGAAQQNVQPGDVDMIDIQIIVLGDRLTSAMIQHRWGLAADRLAVANAALEWLDGRSNQSLAHHWTVSNPATAGV